MRAIEEKKGEIAEGILRQYNFLFQMNLTDGKLFYRKHTKE